MSYQQIKTKIEEAILDGLIDNNYDSAYNFMMSIKKKTNLIRIAKPLHFIKKIVYF